MEDRVRKEFQVQHGYLDIPITQRDLSRCGTGLHQFPTAFPVGVFRIDASIVQRYVYRTVSCLATIGVSLRDRSPMCLENSTCTRSLITSLPLLDLQNILAQCNILSALHMMNPDDFVDEDDVDLRFMRWSISISGIPRMLPGPLSAVPATPCSETNRTDVDFISRLRNIVQPTATLVQGVQYYKQKSTWRMGFRKNR